MIQLSIIILAYLNWKSFSPTKREALRSVYKHVFPNVIENYGNGSDSFLMANPPEC